MRSWRTIFDCLDTLLAGDRGHFNETLVNPVLGKPWGQAPPHPAQLERPRSGPQSVAKTIFSTSTHPAKLVWLCILLLLLRLLPPRILHHLDIVSQLSQHFPYSSTGRCTSTHGLHHTTKTTPTNREHSCGQTLTMFPIQPCWNVAFPCTTLRILTKRGSPNNVDDTTLSLRTWPTRIPFHCCGCAISPRTVPIERENTYESVPSKPRQRTTEEDGGMGDWDTTTQHRRTIYQNGRTHPPRCLSPSAIQTSSCVPCGNIMYITRSFCHWQFCTTRMMSSMA